MRLVNRNNWLSRGRTRGSPDAKGSRPSPRRCPTARGACGSRDMLLAPGAPTVASRALCSSVIAGEKVIGQLLCDRSRGRTSGAAPESKRPSVGLPRRTGFEGLCLSADWLRKSGFSSASGLLGAIRSAELGRRFSRRSARLVDSATVGAHNGPSLRKGRRQMHAGYGSLRRSARRSASRKPGGPGPGPRFRPPIVMDVDGLRGGQRLRVSQQGRRQLTLREQPAPVRERRRIAIRG
jgi:hypothetical protein